MTTMDLVPFPRVPSRVQPLATAPLNDTSSASTHQHRIRPSDNRKRTEPLYTASLQTRPQQFTRSQTGLQRRMVNNESRQRDDKSSGSASIREPDVRPTTTEFPSYESFQNLEGDGRPIQRPYPFRRTTSGDSSEEGESDRENVPYARRSMLDRPRPRSTHFVDFDDAQLSFSRRDDVQNRLRRQSTRRSLELGRFRIQEKQDEVISRIAVTTPSLTDSDNGRRKPSTAFEDRGSNIKLREDQTDGQSRGKGMVSRRGSEMLIRQRDDVIEAKVVLLGSQGKSRTTIRLFQGLTCLAIRRRQDVPCETIYRGSLFRSTHDR